MASLVIRQIYSRIIWHSDS